MIVVLPTDVPSTSPFGAILIEARLVADHAPPTDPSRRLDTRPRQVLGVPVMAAGREFTVPTNTALQPVASVYVILGLPGAFPVRTPVFKSIVAWKLLPLVHVPAGEPTGVDEPPSVYVLPTHMEAGPAMTGCGFTVTVNTAVCGVPQA